MEGTELSYVVLTTARNEEKTIKQVIESVKNQSVKPAAYYLYDDMSEDRTAEIADSLGCIVINAGNFVRSPYSGVNQSRGFTYLVSCIKHDYDYILKLDADSIIPPEYAETLLAAFNKNKSLGIAAGAGDLYGLRQGRITDGARMIRRSCYRRIGGYRMAVGFDSLAVYSARMYGFTCKTLRRLKYRELRACRKRNVADWVINGYERRNMHLGFMHTFMAALKNLLSGSPKILNFFLIMYGYLLYRGPRRDHGLDPDYMRLYGNYEIIQYIHEALSYLKINFLVA